MSADIFAGQPGDADLLAAIYDLEHDQISEDLGFYRRLVRRERGPLLSAGFEPRLGPGGREMRER